MILHYRKYLFAALVLTLTLSSCSEKLELDPYDNVAEEDAFKTEKDVKAALVGAYADLGSSNFYGGRTTLCPDLLANDGGLKFAGTYSGYIELYNKSLTVTNDYAQDIWLRAYRTINTVNNVLAKSGVITDEDSRKQVDAEAKFIRGTIYFEMVRLYAKAWNDGNPTANLGLPIVLKPTSFIAEENYIKRSTVAEVYAQAIKDLTEAKADLPESNGFFANTYAASAVLARIYLTQERWSDAAAEANTVITSEAFELVKNYIDEFPAPDPARPIVNSTEDIFAAQITDQQGFNALNEVYATSDFSGRGEITINQSFIGNYEEIDDRLKVFTISYDDDGNFEEAFCDKYNNQYGNVKTIRLAEMYLIRAEANFRNGSQLGATPLDDVNTIRARAKATLLTTVDLNAILNERVLELAFEGQSLPDLKRTQGSIGGGIQWNSPKLVFPIPQREMDANPALKGQQNEGYGN